MPAASRVRLPALLTFAAAGGALAGAWWATPGPAAHAAAAAQVGVFIPIDPAADEVVFVETEDGGGFLLSDASVLKLDEETAFVTGRAVTESNVLTNDGFGDLGAFTVRVPLGRVRSMRGFDTETLRNRLFDRGAADGAGPSPAAVREAPVGGGDVIEGELDLIEGEPDVLEADPGR